MKLEPRIERLEARQPDDAPVTEITLVGVDSKGSVLIQATARFVDGRYTPFEMSSRR